MVEIGTSGIVAVESAWLEDWPCTMSVRLIKSELYGVAFTIHVFVAVLPLLIVAATAAAFLADAKDAGIDPVQPCG
jgi:hypothetical protein